MLVDEYPRIPQFNFDLSLNKIHKKLGGFFNFDSDEFKQALLLEELFWIEQFLKGIYAHLDSRESQGLKITQHDLIKCQIASIYAEIQMLNMTKLREEKISWKLISDSIRNLCLSLAKLAGARAFLSGNVLEMLWTFERLNQEYWVIT